MDCVQGRTSTSNKSDKAVDKQLPEILPATRLRFSREQLRSLNYHLSQKISCDESQAESGITTSQAESIVERLTQRLICAVGNLDPRFASKFLITLHDGYNSNGRTSLEYLVRLDVLSTPVLYPNDVKPSCEILECDNEGASAGYARIRLRNKTSTKWTEFINASGYLRRDKVQERFVELLALAAAAGWPTSPLDVDESTLCGAPGKVVDAVTLNHILHLAPEEQLYYGAAANNLRFPDPRDFRLAIVDEPAGVRLRVGFLSPSLDGKDVEVRLLVAIGVDAWPHTTNYPGRVPLGHAECLLFHRTAEMGMYLVASGVQSASWQIQLPATEVTLLNHYGPNSTVSIVLKILYNILEEIHSNINEDKFKFAYRLLTPRAIREALWHYLEEDCNSPLQVMLNWTPKHTSKHVLRILDKLVGLLRCQSHPSYFFPHSNLLSNPGHISEEDYLIEANRIHMYMVRLYDEALRPIVDDEKFKRMQMYEDMDAILLHKWCDVVTRLMPPAATRSSRFSFAASKSRREVAYTQYTTRQLEYIGLLLKSMLNVKQSTMQFPVWTEEDDQLSLPENPLEDVIYLLVTIIEQAREHSMCAESIARPTVKSKYRTKTRSHFDTATAKLVEAVRRDKKKDRGSLDFSEDTVLVKVVLRWLYKGLDQSKHSLAPVLRPYLNKLFVSSHEICWHLESIRGREARDEMKALGTFSRLVNTNEVSPASGLIESVNKGWNWARNMLRLVEQSSLRVIFIPDRDKVYRHILSLPSYERTDACIASRSAGNTVRLPSPANISDRSTNTTGTLPARYFYTFLRDSVGDVGLRLAKTNLVISHNELKEASPMTETFRLTHRYGNHRCYGDLIQSLVALHKISILQELSHLLPAVERQEMLDTIQKLCKENKRQVALRRQCTLPPIRSTSKMSDKSSRKLSAPHIYTRTVETAGIREPNAEMATIDPASTSTKQQHQQRPREKSLVESCDTKNTLIGSCRAARIKEDSRMIFHENFKIKALFRSPKNAT